MSTSQLLDEVFPGLKVVEATTFRVTRNEDLEVEEDDAENLLKALEKELLRRRFGPPVRLEVEENIDEHVLELLVRRDVAVEIALEQGVVADLDAVERLFGDEEAVIGVGDDDRRGIASGSATRCSVASNRLRSPVRSRNCLGRADRDSGQRRVPWPPARITGTINSVIGTSSRFYPVCICHHQRGRGQG